MRSPWLRTVGGDSSEAVTRSPGYHTVERRDSTLARVSPIDYLGGGIRELCEGLVPLGVAES
jgi:hypothetical protein